MILTNKNFSFCKEVGILKENFSISTALNTIYNTMTKDRFVDKEFAKQFRNLTESSSSINRYMCVIYQYNIDLDYVVNNKSYNGQISNFGRCGGPDSLNITQYYGKGDYTVVKDLSQTYASKIPAWNEANVFTYEELRAALGKVIEGKLPSGWQRYESRSWDVSAYLVPVIYIKMEYKGKIYGFSFNLHNGCYSCKNYPTDRSTFNRATKAQKLAKVASITSMIFTGSFTLITLLSEELFIFPLIGLVAALVGFFINKKSFKKYESTIENDPKISIFKVASVPLIISLAAFIFSLIAFL